MHLLRTLALLLVVGCVVPDPPPRQVRLIEAPASGDVARLVAKREAMSRDEGRQLLVYVGATWCEPCKRFRDAARSGELDAEFGDVDLLEFDKDRDDPRLEQAGYGSTYVPLVAKPDRDGKGSTFRLQGSLKGEAAVGAILPRLRTILGR